MMEFNDPEKTRIFPIPKEFHLKPRSLGLTNYIAQRFLTAAEIADPLNAFISAVNYDLEWALSRHAHFQWGAQWEREWIERKKIQL
jgi:hypothetical protein